MEKKYYLFKMNLVILQVISTIILITMIITTYLIHSNIIIELFESFTNMKNYLLIIPIIFGYSTLHEILHSIGYVIYGAKIKNITYGMELEKGVFYCLCKQDISKKNILNSLMYPLFYIGILTYIIGMMFEIPILVFLSIINISGAAGDIIYFLFIIKLNKEVMFSEYDDCVSFALLSAEDISKYKHFGLHFIGTQDNIKRDDYKKIKISKLSFIMIILCFILIMVSLLI